jgi:transcriptional regulator with XRE-family HTH domain
MMNTFGEYLRKLRKDKNLSLRDLSLKLNIDSSLIAKIERNERSPSREFIRHVASFFKIEEQKLLHEFLSDFIAYKIIEENVDIDILKAAEEKVNYIKNKTNG